MSSYYLHREESPGMVLVSPFVKSNQLSHMEFINGTLPTPAKLDPNYKAWHRWQYHGGFLDHSIDPSHRNLLQSTIYLNNAKKLWDELKERLTKGNYFRISDPIQEIHSIKQGDIGVSLNISECTWERFMVQ